MLFPENELDEYVLVELAETLAEFPIEDPRPLDCDRWIARSCLQKAIRRGEVELTQRSLANLFEHSPADVWRHLTIICLEDVGVANVDLLAQIIAAKRKKAWRTQLGGDWHVLSGLARMMAESNHCQAACDLLLKVSNDPAMDIAKADALDAEAGILAGHIADTDRVIEERAVAAMALGGCLAEGQQHKSPNCVFEILSETGHSSHVVATCHAAWKISRNPMSMLLPLVWQAWMKDDRHSIADDPLPAVQMIGEVPGYAFDQFTRRGNQISRAYLRSDQELQILFERANIARATHTKALGDVVFLMEGGLAKNRIVWTVGENLRQAFRWLSTAATLQQHLPQVLRHCQAKASQIANERSRSHHT